MNCIEVDLLLQNYFDGELSKPQSSAVGFHLLNCKSCKKEFQKIKSEMRDLLIDISEPYVNLDSIRSKVGSRVATLRPRHPLPVPVVSISASFLLAIALSVIFFQSGKNAPPQTDWLNFSLESPGQAAPAVFSKNGDTQVQVISGAMNFKSLAGSTEKNSSALYLEIYSPSKERVSRNKIQIRSTKGELLDSENYLYEDPENPNRFWIEGLTAGLYQLQIGSFCLPLEIRNGESLLQNIYLPEAP